MTGLEDRIGTVCRCTAAVGGCCCREAAQANVSVMSRRVWCFVSGLIFDFATNVKVGVRCTKWSM
jgi:hypothetical protein